MSMPFALATMTAVGIDPSRYALQAAVAIATGRLMGASLMAPSAGGQKGLRDLPRRPARGKGTAPTPGRRLRPVALGKIAGNRERVWGRHESAACTGCWREEMPTYEYRCNSCGEHVEVFQSFSDDPLSSCGICGGTLKRVFHPVGIVFKGSGFYSTDSRSRSKGSGSSGNSSSGDSGESRASSGSADKRTSDGEAKIA